MTQTMRKNLQQNNPKKHQNIPKLVDADSDDSDNEEEEPHSQKTSPGPVNKELTTQPVETSSAACCTPVTSCTYILTSGLRKDKKCKQKASDETGKFCHLHKK